MPYRSETLSSNLVCSHSVGQVTGCKRPSPPPAGGAAGLTPRDTAIPTPYGLWRGICRCGFALVPEGRGRILLPAMLPGVVVEVSQGEKWQWTRLRDLVKNLDISCPHSFLLHQEHPKGIGLADDSKLC